MLETKRCVLLRLGIEDIELYRTLQRNKEVRKFLGGIADEVDIVRKFNLIIYSRGSYWKVKEKQNSDVIGIVSLDKYYDEINMELSYEFLPDFWGQGYAFESLTKIIDVAFN